MYDNTIAHGGEPIKARMPSLSVSPSSGAGGRDPPSPIRTIRVLLHFPGSTLAAPEGHIIPVNSASVIGVSI